MIRINLLPQELRPITRTPLPHIISLAVLGAALFFMFQVYMSLRGELSGINTQVAQQEAALELLAATVEEHEELEERKKQLQVMVETIQVILEDRTVWSEHLHQLATLTPENIWYKRIRLTSRRFTEERPRQDPRTGQTRIERETHERLVLELSGYAVDDETGLSSTATLATNTTVDPDFASHFQLYTSRIIDTEFDGYPVREFLFEYIVS